MTAHALPDDNVTDDVVKARVLRSLSSVLIERAQWAKRMGLAFNGARDYYEVLGYPETISAEEYRSLYDRGGIAGRTVDAMPRATWRGGCEVIEDEDPKVSTTFEESWTELADRLDLLSVFKRVDILAAQGRYAVLLLGAPGDLSTELPRRDAKLLKYVDPYSEINAGIRSWETNTETERFGQPTSYDLRLLDSTTQRGGYSALTPPFVSPGLQKPVHWSRIIHVPSEGFLDNTVYGPPALERVYNLFQDLMKVTGGGAEAFWIRANQGLHLDIDADAKLTEPERAALKEQADAYQHQIRRMLQTRKVTVTPLGSDVANFSNPADAILTQIAGARAIPKRILTGSEMGELASSQDRENFRDQINGRQLDYAGPSIVKPFVKRLIDYGYLPTPKLFTVRWSHLQVLTEQEKADGAQKWAATVTSDGLGVFPEEEIRDHFYGMAPLSKKQKALLAPPAPAPAEPAAPSVMDAALTAAEEHTYSSTQIQLPTGISEKLIALGMTIPDDDLDAQGRDDDPHVTVKYGVHGAWAGDVRKAVAEFGSIGLTLGKTAVFSGLEYDVVYVEVMSSRLVLLNALIAASVPVTDTHPVYIPHACVAYVKSGLGDKYIGLTALEGLAWVADTIEFRPKAGGTATLSLLAASVSEDAELLSVLESAIRENATGVINRILGMRQTVEPVVEPEAEPVVEPPESPEEQS